MANISHFKVCAGLLSVVIVMSSVSIQPVGAAADFSDTNVNNTTSQHFNQTIEHEFQTIKDFDSGFLEHAAKTSPYNETLAAILDTFDEPASRARRSIRTRRTPEAIYISSFFKIIWQFINGIARPFLKTYLAPIQMLYTFMSPRMFLRDCFGATSVGSPVSRALSPFTIGPAAQAFFVCAVDIISQLILCIKLLANMTTSIF